MKTNQQAPDQEIEYNPKAVSLALKGLYRQVVQLKEEKESLENMKIENLNIIALRSYISLLKDPDNWSIWSPRNSKTPVHLWKNTNYRTPMQIAQSMENVLKKLEEETSNEL